MREEAKFIGRRYKSNEMKGIQAAMDEWGRESLLPMEGEKEKTEEQLRMIRTANELLRNELDLLGIKDYRYIEPERIHFFDKSTYEKHFPNSNEQGAYKSISDLIAIDMGEPELSKEQLFVVILHEMVHRASKQKFNEYGEDKDGKGIIAEARVGYRVKSRWKQPERRALTGLNEVLVEGTILKIIRKNSGYISRELGMDSETLRHGSFYVYMDYAPVLERIVQGIALHRGITEIAAFDLLERGQFTETVLALKDIDRIFGRGSLEVLSCMGTLRDDAARAEVDSHVLAYFEATDESERHLHMMSALGTFGRYLAKEKETEAEP